MKKLSFLFAMLLTTPAFADFVPPPRGGGVGIVDAVLIILMGLAAIVFIATSLVLYRPDDNMDLGRPKHIPPYKIPPRPRQ